MIHAGPQHQGRARQRARPHVQGELPDIRNSKVIDIIRELHEFGVETFVHDPRGRRRRGAARVRRAPRRPGTTLPAADAIILAVAHRSFLEMPPRRCCEKIVRARLPHRREVGARCRGVPPRRAARVAAVAPDAFEPSATAPSRRAPRKLRVGVFADAPLQPRWIVEALAQARAPSRLRRDRRVIAAAARRRARAPPRSGASTARSTAWPSAPSCRGGDLAAARAPQLRVELGVARCRPRRRLRAGRRRRHARSTASRATASGASASAPMRATREALAGLREVLAASRSPPPASRCASRAERPARLAYQSWSRTYPFSVARNRAQLLREDRRVRLPRAARAAPLAAPAGSSSCTPVPREAHAGAAARRSATCRAHRSARIAAARRREGAARSSSGSSPIAFARRTATLAPATSRGFTRLDAAEGPRTGPIPSPSRRTAATSSSSRSCRSRTGKAHISMIEVDARRQRLGAGAACSSATTTSRTRSWSRSDGAALHDPGERRATAPSRSTAASTSRCAGRLERVLMDGVRLVDATLPPRRATAGGCSPMPPPARAGVFDDELHLFHADRLLGDWQPHPRNPVKSDARCARPAGRLFWRDGALYRPAQICVPRYGAGLVDQPRAAPHAARLRRAAGRAHPAAAASGLLGLHTMNRAGDLTVVDAFARRSPNLERRHGNPPGLRTLVMLGAAPETRGSIAAVVDAYRSHGLFKRWPIDLHRDARRGSTCDNARLAQRLGRSQLLRAAPPRRRARAHCAPAGFWREAPFMGAAIAARCPLHRAPARRRVDRLRRSRWFPRSARDVISSCPARRRASWVRSIARSPTCVRDAAAGGARGAARRRRSRTSILFLGRLERRRASSTCSRRSPRLRADVPRPAPGVRGRGRSHRRRALRRAPRHRRRGEVHRLGRPFGQARAARARRGVRAAVVLARRCR